MSRVDVTVTLGSVERWLLVNTAQELHHFHIHQGSFQVESLDNVSLPFYGYQDTLPLPLNGSVSSIIIPFTDEVILGNFVFHCHVLAHEALGMMMRINVVS